MKHGETCCEGLERTQRARTVTRGLLQELTSEPWTKIWHATTFPYRQNIGRLGKVFSVRQKFGVLGVPEQDPLYQIFTNEDIW